MHILLSHIPRFPVMEGKHYFHLHNIGMDNFIINMYENKGHIYPIGIPCRPALNRKVFRSETIDVQQTLIGNGYCLLSKIMLVWTSRLGRQLYRECAPNLSYWALSSLPTLLVVDTGNILFTVPRVTCSMLIDIYSV